MNYIPPTITISNNESVGSINITWLPYHLLNWNSGQLLGYIVYYEEVTAELDYNMTLYKNKFDTDNVTTTILLIDLKPFTNYSIYVTTVNDIGIGYGAHVFCRTKETCKFCVCVNILLLRGRLLEGRSKEGMRLLEDLR